MRENRNDPSLANGLFRTSTKQHLLSCRLDKDLGWILSPTDFKKQFLALLNITGLHLWEKGECWCLQALQSLLPTVPSKKIPTTVRKLLASLGSVGQSIPVPVLMSTCSILVQGTKAWEEDVPFLWHSLPS